MSIFKIISQCPGQNSSEENDEDTFFVLLEEGGKRLKRTRKELLEIAPKQLKSFTSTLTLGSSSDVEMKESKSKVKSKSNRNASEEEEDSDDFAIIIQSNRNSKSKAQISKERERVEKERIRKSKGKGKARATTEDEKSDEEDEEESNKDDAASFDEDEVSSSEHDNSNDSDASNSSEDRRSKKKRKKDYFDKPIREGTRKSTRETGERKKTFDMEISSDEENQSSASNSSRPIKRSTRATKHSSSTSSPISSDEMTLRSLLPNNSKKGKTDSRSDSNPENNEYEDIKSDSESSSAENVKRPQDEHRKKCNRCGKGPAAGLLADFRRKQKKGGRSRKRKMDEEDSEQEQERLQNYGAWIECGTWCLPEPFRNSYLKEQKAKHLALHTPVEDESIVKEGEEDENIKPIIKIPKRIQLEKEVDRVIKLAKCYQCKKNNKCFVCSEAGKQKAQADMDMVEDARNAPGLMFRCSKCTRASHYDCLEKDDLENYLDFDFEAHVRSYILAEECHECYRWRDNKVDIVLAWREVDYEQEYDTEGEEIINSKKSNGELPTEKDLFCPAEYLVKWSGLSYRKIEWIPHSFLAATNAPKIKNFLKKGSSVSFSNLNQDVVSSDDEEEEENNVSKINTSAPLPDKDALDKVPIAWTRVERVLDVVYKRHGGAREERWKDFRNLPSDPEDSLDLVFKCYMKWTDLPYSAATLEKPPTVMQDGYEQYEAAYLAFLKANEFKMSVPNLSTSQMEQLDRPRTSTFKPLKVQPASIVGGKLMDYQLEGVNFLYGHWWRHSSCLLGDEMGLGKTLQVIAFLSTLSVRQGARPFLIAVPNSTIGNWMREFARWAPSLRVVSYSGGVESQDVIEKFELFDHTKRNLKTHVVVATYESLQKNILVFKRVCRWDVLVVDEAQRLKGGVDGLLFKALRTLNINVRVLLTGTPMQNNIRELFNMLNFINPSAYGNVKALEERYKDLTPAKVEEIRALLKPYFLRRTKETVLDLPPMSEAVLPVSMASLQRKLYASILSRDAATIDFIASTLNGKAGKVKGVKSLTKSAKTKVSSNILMELRKVLGHPYLISPELDDATIPEVDQHKNLVDASAKLILLSKLLPKLKAKGHRVLIFSQFKIVLNILESFLFGLKLKYLRLDGDTASLDRQRGIDAYNAKDSTYFCYLLSTRAGGAGINLATADTVILFDQDFNPQQDLQATSRCHRIGQVKPVRVFRLVVKGTVEERIFLTGNKKLGLDHLIIQRIDAKSEEADEMAGVLAFGAEAIFNEEIAEANRVTYTDDDIDKILAVEPVKKPKGEDSLFAVAQEWNNAKNSLEDVDGDVPEVATTDGDFWAKLLIETEAAAEAQAILDAAKVGRGKRNRGNVGYGEGEPITVDSQGRPLKKVKTGDDDDADFAVPDAEEEDLESDSLPEDNTLLDEAARDLQVPIDPNAPLPPPRKKRGPNKIKAAQVSLDSIELNHAQANAIRIKNEENRLANERLALQQKQQKEVILQQQQNLVKPEPKETQAFKNEKDRIHVQNIQRITQNAIRFKDSHLNHCLKLAADSLDHVQSRLYLKQATDLLQVYYTQELNLAKARSSKSKAPSSITNVQSKSTSPSKVQSELTVKSNQIQGQSSGSHRKSISKPNVNVNGASGSGSGSNRNQEFEIEIPISSPSKLVKNGESSKRSNSITSPRKSSVTSSQSSKSNTGAVRGSFVVNKPIDSSSSSRNTPLASTSNSTSNSTSKIEAKPQTKPQPKVSSKNNDSTASDISNNASKNNNTNNKNVAKIVEKAGKEKKVVVSKTNVVIDLTLDSDSD